MGSQSEDEGSSRLIANRAVTKRKERALKRCYDIHEVKNNYTTFYLYVNKHYENPTVVFIPM